MKSHAQVAVIGGGIMGCAMLYQLTRQGCRDAILIEKGELTSGSTWHAAGQVPHFAEHPLFARIQYESFESYKRLEAETGEPAGVHAVGSLRLARTKDEIREYRRFLATASRLGIEGEIIGPNETRALWPLLEFNDFEGALHTFNDGYTDPAQTTNGFAKAARNRGAEIYRHTRVTGLHRTQSGEWRIETDQGEIIAENVVNAAGIWGTEISAMVGGYLPILAIEHEYLVTEEVPELAEFGHELPVFRDLSVPTYLRQERGGLIVACYEDHPVFWGLDGIPKDFGQELFAPDIERAAPNLEMTANMVPILNRLGIKTVVNGPTGRTADLKPCVGPAHGAPNYYRLCGVVGGFLQSGFAKYLAEWVLECEPSIDLSPVDVRRFGDYATQSYAVAKVSVGHAYSNPVYYPHAEPSCGRLARCTPLYGVLKAKGACFGVDNGWEVPNWFAPTGVDPEDSLSFERQNWVEYAAAEARAAKETAALLDLSSRSKFEVSGPDAESFLARLSASALPEMGSVSRALLLTPKGRIAAALEVERCEQELYLTGEGAFELQILDWLLHHKGDLEVCVANVTARDGVLWLAGPNATAILVEAGVSEALAHCAVERSQEVVLGPARVRMRRVDRVMTPAFEIIHPIESQVAVYETLVAAGAAHGLKNLGRRGYESLRLESGIGLWGTDFASDSTPSEAGLGTLVSSKSAEFIGREAVSAPSDRCLTRLVIAPGESTTVDPWGGEPVFSAEREVGVVTSGGFAPALDHSLAFAMLDVPAVKTGTHLEVEILGVRRAAIVSHS